MKISDSDQSRLGDLYRDQLFAVLGTRGEGDPYLSLVAFSVTEDYGSIVFATKRKRLKYRNMIENPRVTLMIDNRKNRPSDFEETISVALIGDAEDVSGKSRQELAEFLLARHPGLRNFVESDDCAIVKVGIDKMYIVSDFESVVRVER
ncbi:MAG: pyridoxamine 5'-phosphate oxidase family protein [Candidatus Thorarchaeota archaeon]|nr:MAG: pyridoxamine 5'-phosphate oxidase family protein [Candidatus Thorarchaeota archaeon]